jgi:hypothetical protein
VTANGSWDKWPVAAWVDRAGLQIAAEAEKGKLQATVDPQAEPGVYWLRLTNADGATAIRPFVVGTLPEIVEQEPNDDGAKPRVLDHPVVINGRLGKREDVDIVAVQLKTGQTLVASFQANEDLGSTVDGVLQICSADRFVLAQNDDARGLDPMLAWTAPADGLYLVRAFGFPATPDSSIAFAGNDAYLYRLTITTGGFVDHALPLAVSRGASMELELVGWNLPDSIRRISLPPAEKQSVLAFHPEAAQSVQLPVVPHPSIVVAPDCGPDRPQPLAIPSTVTGLIESPRDEDTFTFVARKEQPIAFQVESDELGFLLDGALTVVDSAGKVVAEADDTRRVRDPQLVFSAPADAEYRIVIRDVHGHGGPRYVYRLTAQESQPTFDLKLAADSFVAKRGSSVEIAVSIERGRGFDQEIEIYPVELPSGFAGESVVSMAKGETAKSVKLVLQASPEAQSGTFRVVGKSRAEAPMERTAQLGGDGVPATVPQAWLTAIAPN